MNIALSHAIRILQRHRMTVDVLDRDQVDCGGDVMTASVETQGYDNLICRFSMPGKPGEACCCRITAKDGEPVGPEVLGFLQKEGLTNLKIV